MAKKTFPHAVIYDGVFYPANSPIEVKEPVKKAVVKNDGGASKESKSGD